MWPVCHLSVSVFWLIFANSMPRNFNEKTILTWYLKSGLWFKNNDYKTVIGFLRVTDIEWVSCMKFIARSGCSVRQWKCSLMQLMSLCHTYLNDITFM